MELIFLFAFLPFLFFLTSNSFQVTDAIIALLCFFNNLFRYPISFAILFHHSLLFSSYAMIDAYSLFSSTSFLTVKVEISIMTSHTSLFSLKGR